MVDTEPSAPKVGESELARQWVGRTIADSYKIIEVLGEGGMGAVFVAEHLRLRKHFAFKTIRPEFAGDGQVKERFRREAHATSQIDHPHVVSATDFGDLPDGGAYLVIQLVRGKSLAKYITDSPLPWRQVTEIGAQIADALATCHALGIIHRDLKPDNVLLERRDDGSFHARLVDFGIAHLSGESGADDPDANLPITRMGAVIGTPGYMAPEQAVGQAIDHRVDLYALGVLLWEACTGQRLWQGDSLTALFARQLAGTAPPLREVLAGQVPDALDELVTQLLAPTPSQRPGVAGAVRDDLRRLAFSGDSLISAATGSGLHLSSIRAPITTTSQVNHHLVALAPTTPDHRSRLSQLASHLSQLASHFSLLASRLTPHASRLLQLARERPRLTAYILGALLFVLLLPFLCSRGDPPTPHAPATNTSSTKRHELAPTVAPAPKTDAPTSAPAPAPAPADNTALTELPAAYVKHAETLLTSTNSKSRKRAGEAIAEANEADKAAIPEYIRQLAWIEKLRDCDDKLPVLLKITDPRALPGLQTLAQTKSRCRSGIFGSSDCLSCLRGDLGLMIGRFEARE